MRTILKILSIMIVTASIIVSCSNTAPKTPITLLQNKPEIDAALQVYAQEWSKTYGIKLTAKSVGGSTTTTLQQQLKADFAAGDMPDIFVIEGIEDYKDWESIILDLSNEKWVADTNVAYKVNGKVVGFPVAIEGWGMAYNADMLSKAGIDPATLNNYDAYKAAFEKLNGMKSELGINSVVSMAAGPEMGWVTAHHNFNSLLAAGLPYGDMSVVNDLLARKVDITRLQEYAEWVELLFKYADKAVLTTGNYDAQVNAFATGKAIFLHQGNWTDPNIMTANANFKMGFAPHGSMHRVTDGIFVSAPSYYVINAESKNVEGAKKYLNDLVYSQQGQDFIVNKAGMIPAFKNNPLRPSGPLSQSVQEWASRGKIYSWLQYYFSLDLRNNVLAPIYNQFAKGSIDKSQFVDLMKNAFER